MSDGENQEVSTKVLSEPNEASKKCEEPLVEFKMGSALQQFLIRKSKNEIKAFTFQQILVLLKDIIKSEGLYDPRNLSIILCSEELEIVFNRKVIHLSELRELVLTQIVNTVEIALHKNRLHKHSATKLPKIIVNKVHSNQTRRFFIDPNTKFEVQLRFLSVLRSVKDADKTKTEFSINEIRQLLSEYIVSKRETIVDQRNIRIAIVKGDPLGQAFKVTAFHRCQVMALIDQQLVCQSLKQEAAWRIVRSLNSKKDIDRLEIPKELKGTLNMMLTSEMN